MNCDNCDYKNDNGPERLRNLETQQGIQQKETHFTNVILERIEKSLIKYIEDSEEDIRDNKNGIKENLNAIKDMSPENAVLRDRSNTQQQLNFKALAGLIFMVGMFLTIIVSIVFN